MLVHPGVMAENNILDVSLDWIPEFKTTKKRDEVLLHLGTAETPGILKLLRAGTDHESALGRIELRQPVAALPGDRFVLRRPSPAHTIAGGSVIDAFPALRMNRVRTLVRLDRLRNADPATRIRVLVEDGKDGSCLTHLVRATGLPAESVRHIVDNHPELLLFRNGEAIVTKMWLHEKRTRLFTWLTAFHAKHPELTGAPLAASRLGLSPELASIVVAGFTPLRVQGETIALANHQARWSSQQIQMLAKIEAAFRNGGFQPPLPSEALTAADGDLQQHRSLLESLIKGKRLVRVAPGVIFHCEAMAQIRASVTQHRGRAFSVPEFKEWMKISRKYAIPLLEYLDREHVTRRVGDAREVL
jgi:selenocysteine-specific elongation factor